MRILALDLGERRIGVAISDPQGRIALPLTTIHRRDDASALAAVCDIIGERGVEAVVVGLPLSLDGSVGRQAEAATAFAAALGGRLAIPVVQWDERLSTVEAERQLRAAGYSGRTMKDRRDAAAAAIVLQAYLDRPRGEAGG